MKITSTLQRLFMVSLALSLAACSNNRGGSNANSDLGKSQTISIPPKQLVDIAKEVITSPPYSLKVENEDKGKLVSGYQPYQGEWHIIRYWPQRTRYIVLISPDFDEPTTKSHLEVMEETQQQAAGAQKWTRDADLDYPDRAAAMAKAIRDAAIAAQAKK